jgi:hypothetical protein
MTREHHSVVIVMMTIMAMMTTTQFPQSCTMNVSCDLGMTRGTSFGSDSDDDDDDHGDGNRSTQFPSL